MEETESGLTGSGERCACSTSRINTTLGELISAIADAAAEARVDEAELAVITKLVLEKLTRRYSSCCDQPGSREKN